MNVVIVGARERKESDEDKKRVEELLKGLREQYKRQLQVISVGADKGVGKYVRDFCISNKIIFAEVRIKLEGEDIPRGFFAQMFMSRNMSLLDVADEYYIFTGPNQTGIIEAIIEPARRRMREKKAGRVEVFGQ